MREGVVGRVAGYMRRVSLPGIDARRACDSGGRAPRRARARAASSKEEGEGGGLHTLYESSVLGRAGQVFGGATRSNTVLLRATLNQTMHARLNNLHPQCVNGSKPLSLRPQLAYPCQIAHAP
eukprot:3663167-Prymnesium_polylepis.2